MRWVLVACLSIVIAGSTVYVLSATPSQSEDAGKAVALPKPNGHAQSAVPSPHSEPAEVHHMPVAEQNMPVADRIGVEQLAFTGNAEAQRQLSEMYEACSSYSRAPTTHVATMRHIASLNPGSEARIETLIRRTEAYCSSFDGGEPIPLEAGEMWLKEAAKNGDLIARARLATRNMDPISSEEFDGLLNDILIAGDPDALFEVSGLMRNPPAGSSVLPDELFGGSGLTEHAWAITSCRMGAAACQADSTLLNNICAEMGRCNYLSYEHFVTNELLPPADRARLQAAIREITSLIQGRSSKSP